MSLHIADGIIRIEGNATVEDAEPILAALIDRPDTAVDVGHALRMHSAVVQLLIALRPRIVGRPADAFLSAYIFPMLDAGQ